MKNIANIARAMRCTMLRGVVKPTTMDLEQTADWFGESIEALADLSQEIVDDEFENVLKEAARINDETELFWKRR